MYSLSTCWNAKRFTDGRAMLEEIRSMGFEYAELGHNTRISLLEGEIGRCDCCPWGNKSVIGSVGSLAKSMEFLVNRIIKG